MKQIAAYFTPFRSTFSFLFICSSFMGTPLWGLPPLNIDSFVWPDSIILYCQHHTKKLVAGNTSPLYATFAINKKFGIEKKVSYLQLVPSDVITYFLHNFIKPIYTKDHKRLLVRMNQLIESNRSILLKSILHLGMPDQVYTELVKRAIRLQHHKLLQLLLENGQKEKCRDIHDMAKTIIGNDYRSLQLLLAHGCNPNLRNEWGDTLMALAIQKNNKRLVKLLLTYHADCELSDYKGIYPLHVAAAHSNSSILKLLIKNKVDLNAQDLYGNTPLHCAAQNSNKKCMQCLMRHGADDTIVNKSGHSPWYVFYKIQKVKAYYNGY